ncbi:two-component sensor histidine kinase [Erysipelothrix amsterdamensis]|uniref:histidine kinase n=1 Tax=Erysipelothrix amsterdamensis TaxID=2929157 RepID=A0AAU9VLE7_9FIRM|nr:two-component sensor histidine kinase [Erysipelothrix sp. A18Y020d]CAH2762760.1 two-component sensor histidine kinase [Erysipelothrix sp. A18Y020d]
MLRKENKIQLLILVLLSVIALWSRTVVSILFLSLGMALLFILDTLNTKNKVETIKEDVEMVKKEATVQADYAYDRTVQLINAIPSPLVYIDQRGDFEVSNQYFDQLIHVDAKSVYDVKIDSPIRQTLLDAFLNEKQFVRQVSYQDVEFQVLSIPFLTEKRRYNGCMLIFQDVTRILEGEKMQKRFIADASHELRTPIASIKGMVEILNRPEFDDTETLEEFLKQIEKENNRLDHIVEDLLLQSRLKSNTVYLEKTVFNLKQFFDGLIYERRQELHQANIKVVLNCPSNITVYADQFRLSQVFLNLFNNAINYAENGRIKIQCDTDEDYVHIDFMDNGKGMEPDLIPHIFERFYRGEKDRSRENGGSGLGLAISKSIVEAHGGTINVTSKIDKGTTFTIKLTQN